MPAREGEIGVGRADDVVTELEPRLRRQGLFPCDAEIARRLSLGVDRFRRILPALEAQGFPRRDVLIGGRYWPAVLAFWNRKYGVDRVAGSAMQPDGEENLDAL